MGNMTQLVRDAYNKCADDYNLKRGAFTNRKYLDELNGCLKPNSEILDIGCGAGVPVDKYLVSKGHRLTGVDISEKQIELAKVNVPQASYSVGDMLKVKYRADSFDAVVSFYAIFHIPKERHLEIFKKIYDLLKTGGFFLATLGFEEWEGCEEFHGVTMHWSHFGKDKNLELIERAGFEIVRAEVDDSGGEHHLVVMGMKI